MDWIDHSAVQSGISVQEIGNIQLLIRMFGGSTAPIQFDTSINPSTPVSTLVK